MTKIATTTAVIGAVEAAVDGVGGGGACCQSNGHFDQRTGRRRLSVADRCHLSPRATTCYRPRQRALARTREGGSRGGFEVAAADLELEFVLVLALDIVPADPCVCHVALPRTLKSRTLRNLLSLPTVLRRAAQVLGRANYFVRTEESVTSDHHKTRVLRRNIRIYVWRDLLSAGENHSGEPHLPYNSFQFYL